MNRRELFVCAFQGKELQLSDAEKLEKRLSKTPLDLTSRLTLLGFYTHVDTQGGTKSYNKFAHVRWLIENQSNLPSVLHEFVSLKNFPEFLWLQAAKGWEQQVAKNPQDPVVLLNASLFLFDRDFDRGFSMLTQLQNMFPDNLQYLQLTCSWSFKAMLEFEHDTRHLNFAERIIQDGNACIRIGGLNVADLWTIYSQLSYAAYELDDLEQAIYYTEQAPRSSTLSPSPLQFKNSRLGLVALKRNDTKTAKGYLLNSVCPQFFPYRLAVALSSVGEHEAVKECIAEYLKCETARLDIEVALNAIKGGLVPLVNGCPFVL
ncbi:MAG TPA: hypothetical protein V6C86_25700 [Oculatellaceae cyanobacterium]